MARPPLALMTLALILGCSDDQIQGPALSSVVPDRGLNTAATAVEIRGERFYLQATQQLRAQEGLSLNHHFELWLSGPGDAGEGYPVANVEIVDQGTLSAIIPPGLPPGAYSVSLVGPTGADRLERGFTVLDQVTPDLDAAGQDGATGDVLLPDVSGVELLADAGMSDAAPPDAGALDSLQPDHSLPDTLAIDASPGDSGGPEDAGELVFHTNFESDDGTLLYDPLDWFFRTGSLRNRRGCITSVALVSGGDWEDLEAQTHFNEEGLCTATPNLVGLVLRAQGGLACDQLSAYYCAINYNDGALEIGRLDGACEGTVLTSIPVVDLTPLGSYDLFFRAQGDTLSCTVSGTTLSPPVSCSVVDDSTSLTSGSVGVYIREAEAKFHHLTVLEVD